MITITCPDSDTLVAEENEFTEKVRAGIEFLDENCPDWFSKINLDTLDMRKCSKCVLGQLFGDFDAKEAISLGLGTGNNISKELGFSIYVDDNYESLSEKEQKRIWSLLTKTWVDELRQI